MIIQITAVLTGDSKLTIKRKEIGGAGGDSNENEKWNPESRVSKMLSLLGKCKCKQTDSSSAAFTSIAIF